MFSSDFIDEDPVGLVRSNRCPDQQASIPLYSAFPTDNFNVSNLDIIIFEDY